MQKIDIMQWTTRLALELIGQSGLGYSFDGLEENSILHPYGLAVKQLSFVHLSTLYARILTYDHRSATTPSAIQSRIILPNVVRLGTPKFRRFLVENSPFKSIKDLKALIDIFHNTSVEIYEGKKHAYKQGNEELAAQIEQGKDIISILSTSFFFPFMSSPNKKNDSEGKHEGIRRRKTFRSRGFGPNQVSLYLI